MKKILSIGLFLLMQVPIFAHSGHGENFLSGLWHPVSGIDHLLTMLALGLWAYQMGGPARWIIPVSFTLAMFAASVAAVSRIPLPYPEHGILASLMVAGMLLAIGVRLPLFAAATITVFFALFHGYAHGIEMPSGSPTYFIGFLTTSLTLLLSGVGLGTLLKKTPVLIRIAGAFAVGCAGFLYVHSA